MKGEEESIRGKEIREREILGRLVGGWVGEWGSDLVSGGVPTGD
jgi:hypothetical protein